MGELIKINNLDLQVKEFNGLRVITLKDVDVLHERPEGTASRNFSENRKHFIENQDYFKVKLTNNEIRSQFGAGKNASELILITEGGYLMLVKSLTDDLAWKVQRELVNNYFRVKENNQKQLSPMDELKLHYQVLETHEERLEKLEKNLPLFNVECKELQALVRKIGTKALGGYKSLAYNDNSLRGKVYSDIQHQLKREFGISRYEAIKRCQLETAMRIVEEYKVPMVLVNEINVVNNQIGFDKEVV